MPLNKTQTPYTLNMADNLFLFFLLFPSDDYDLYETLSKILSFRPALP